jgi:hypothetical protein
MRSRWMMLLALLAASAGCQRASYRTSYGGGGDISGMPASDGGEATWGGVFEGDASAYDPTFGLVPEEPPDVTSPPAEHAPMPPVLASASLLSSDTGSGGEIVTEASGLAIGTRGPTLPPEIDEALRAREIAGAERARLAEATTRAGEAHDTATDAGAPALMVYTAGFHVGVYQVRQAQEAIATAARALGGFVASQNDEGIVIRVPVARFFEAVDAVSGTGDVLHRDVRATDVSEEFHDNDIRIRNLEAMRDRLEELLRRAADVEDALAVEAQLERITVELERLRGRQRFLADRVSLSTIAVTFRALAADPIEDAEFFVLPFEWLRSLGLPSLLSVE